jgi:hypothetical protein
MKRIAVQLILGLALAACTGAPATEAEWVPCSGYGSYEGASSYARCIKHIAFLPETRARW